MSRSPGRLHPATILIELARRLGQLLSIVLFALVLRWMSGAERATTLDFIIAGLATLSAVGAVLRYVSLRYAIEGEQLIIHSGILFRQHRTIPLSRIQNISLTRGVLHQLFDVVDLNVETAGGREAEAKLSVLGAADAERLKARLLERAHAGAATEPRPSPGAAVPGAAPAAQDEGRIVWHGSIRDLALAGATENRAGLMVATVAGVFYTFQDVLRPRAEALFPMLETIAGSGTWTIILLGTAAVVLLVIVGWILSIVLTVVQFYGFTLRRDAERLRQRYGLLTQHDLVMPLRRIQVMRMDAPWMRRLFGFVTVYAETAGSVMDKQSAATSPLCPLLLRSDAGGFCRNVFEDLDFDGLRWSPVSRLTIRRALLRYLFVGAVLLTPLFFYRGWVVWPLVPLVAGLALLGAWLRYRSLGFAESDAFVLARAGVLTQRTWVIPHGKIQLVELTQTPFQRRLALANLGVLTAGGSSHATIVDLPFDTAAALRERLSRQANARGLMLDGV